MTATQCDLSPAPDDLRGTKPGLKAGKGVCGESVAEEAKSGNISGRGGELKGEIEDTEKTSRQDTYKSRINEGAKPECKKETKGRGKVGGLEGT